jgi:DNA-binding transcriptional ArsR family regulator
MNGYAADIDRCDCTIIHEEVVAEVRKHLPEEEKLLDLADLFKMFGDSTRIKILSALLHSEMCVCDIAALLGMTKSAISHQLRALRQTKLVKYRRDGKVVYYSLDDDHVGTIFEQGLRHVNEPGRIS